MPHQATKNLDHLHSLDSFGIRKVSLNYIRVERLEDRLKPGVPFPHRHDFFQIILMTSGKGKHHIDFINYDVFPFQVFVMKPGQMHSWDLSRDAKGYVIEFNRQSLHLSQENTRLLEQFTHSPDTLSLKGPAEFKALKNLSIIMLEEFNAKAELYDLSLQSYLRAFLIKILRLHERGANLEKGLSSVEKFKTLLENHFREQHGVEFYAKKLATTPKALTMQLTRAVGRPPRQIIQERILLEAKRFLSFSDLSIAEIGYELGFADANYFTRFFRQHEKKNPTSFRKKKG